VYYITGAVCLCHFLLQPLAAYPAAAAAAAAAGSWVE